MRVIFEQDTEGFDFLEIILHPIDLEVVENVGISEEFKKSPWGKRPINICIRCEES